jgi:hypothetical protein
LLEEFGADDGVGVVKALKWDRLRGDSRLSGAGRGL